MRGKLNQTNNRVWPQTFHRRYSPHEIYGMSADLFGLDVCCPKWRSI